MAKQYIENYFRSLGLHPEADVVFCEYCGIIANDIHHIEYKSQGGTDEPENLIALCRYCHNSAHDSIIDKEMLQLIAEDRCEKET